MNIEIDGIYDLIEVLNDKGSQIVEIDSQYFTIEGDFHPADKNTPYHVLQGRHISKILNDHKVIGIQQIEAVMQKIEKLPVRDVKYSHHYKWRHFIR